MFIEYGNAQSYVLAIFDDLGERGENTFFSQATLDKFAGSKLGQLKSCTECAPQGW